MLESQKFTLRISEIRQRLNELSGKKEKLTDAESSEIGKLQTEFADTEQKFRAALTAESDKAEQRFAGNDGESRERIELRDRVSIVDYIRSAQNEFSVEGEAKEFNESLNLNIRGSHGGTVIPHELLEERADVPTTTTQLSGGVNQRPIIERIFGSGITEAMAISMHSVPSGQSQYQIFKTGTDPAMFAESGTVESIAATFEAKTLVPKRLSARYQYSVELSAQVPQVESALRRDLSMAMKAKIAQLVLTGAGTPEIDGLLPSLTRPARPTAVPTWKGIASLSASAVDGLFSDSEGENNVAVSIELYKLFASVTVDGVEISALEALRRRAKRVITSSFFPLAPTSGGSSGRQDEAQGIIHLGNGNGRNDSVIGVWQGIELINDRFTGSASGQTFLTAIQLLDAALPLRPQAYQRISLLLKA